VNWQEQLGVRQELGKRRREKAREKIRKIRRKKSMYKLFTGGRY